MYTKATEILPSFGKTRGHGNNGGLEAYNIRRRWRGSILGQAYDTNTKEDDTDDSDSDDGDIRKEDFGLTFDNSIADLKEDKETTADERIIITLRETSLLDIISNE